MNRKKPSFRVCPRAKYIVKIVRRSSIVIVHPFGQLLPLGHLHAWSGIPATSGMTMIETEVKVLTDVLVQKSAQHTRTCVIVRYNYCHCVQLYNKKHIKLPEKPRPYLPYSY